MAHIFVSGLTYVLSGKGSYFFLVCFIEDENAIILISGFTFPRCVHDYIPFSVLLCSIS